MLHVKSRYKCVFSGLINTFLPLTQFRASKFRSNHGWYWVSQGKQSRFNACLSILHQNLIRVVSNLLQFMQKSFTTVNPFFLTYLALEFEVLQSLSHSHSKTVPSKGWWLLLLNFDVWLPALQSPLQAGRAGLPLLDPLHLQHYKGKRRSLKIMPCSTTPTIHTITL